MLTKKQLDAIERACEVAEDEGDYNMKENRSDYTDRDRATYAARIKAMHEALAILRFMAGREIFTVTWGLDGGDNVHAKVYLTDQKTRRRTPESMMMARAIVSGPALYNALRKKAIDFGQTAEEKALLDYIETGRKP